MRIYSLRIYCLGFLEQNLMSEEEKEGGNVFLVWKIFFGGVICSVVIILKKKQRIILLTLSDMGGDRFKNFITAYLVLKNA